MKRLILISTVLLLASPAAARPGFTIGLGIGATSVSGESVGVDRLTSDSAQLVDSPALTTDIDGGISGLFLLGFNVLGYAAIETRLTGQGHDLSNADKRSWAAHWHTGVRVYPMWYWQDQLPDYLQPLEPSIFVGWGLSYQVYVPKDERYSGVDEVGWSGIGSWRFGLGVEYFILSYFKLALDYSYVTAPYDTFIYNFDDDITFSVDPSATTGYHQFFLATIFQFGPAQD